MWYCVRSKKLISLFIEELRKAVCENAHQQRAKNLPDVFIQLISYANKAEKKAGLLGS